MKKNSLFLLLTCFTVFYASGQKAKIQTAYNFFKEPYQQYDKAKEAIDEAILNEQSAGMAKTWYYRGLIYQALYKNEKYGQLCDNCLLTAFESFQKANEKDPKNEWVEEIKLVRIPFLANKFFENGVNAFKEKDFAKALSEFETVQKMTPGDTSVILNSAYSAERAGNKEKTKLYFSQLIGMKYPDDKIYLSLANVYKQDNDTSNALKTIRTGRTIYPDSLELMLGEINILLAGGKNEEATMALNAATQKDPNNQNLYLALGSTYDNLANPRDKDHKELPKPKNYNELMMKAEEAYKKGLAINPDNYELNYNIGASYFNIAAEMANQANKISANDPSYLTAKETFEQKFKSAEPYLVKALDNNPRKTEDDLTTFDQTLSSLKQLYARSGETVKYNKVKDIQEKKRTSFSDSNNNIKGTCIVILTKKNGVYEIPVSINGLNLNIIFDTGASDVSISSAEAIVLFKQGKLEGKDFLGSANHQIANGKIEVGEIINIKELQIGDCKKLIDVKASISNNPNAPILLGQSALSKYGKITIDYVANSLTIE